MSEVIHELAKMYEPEKFKLKCGDGQGYYEYYLHRCPQVTGIIGRLAFKINESTQQSATIAQLERENEALRGEVRDAWACCAEMSEVVQRAFMTMPVKEKPLFSVDNKRATYFIRKWQRQAAEKESGER